VTLGDQDGEEQLKLETPAGQKVTLKDGPGSIEIADSNGNTVKFGTSGITVTSAGKVTVNASAVEVSALTLTVNAAMSQFNGIVQATTAVISPSIVGSTYTPVAGNSL